MLVDLEKHYGRGHKYVNYDDLRRVLDADKVVIGQTTCCCSIPATDEIIKMNKKVDPDRVHAMCCVSMAATSDFCNGSPTAQFPALASPLTTASKRCPQPGPEGVSSTHRCRFTIIVFSNLAWITKSGGCRIWHCGSATRSAPAAAAPPLRLPGAVGSPATPRGDSVTSRDERHISGACCRRPADGRFTLLDVGCSGGIERRWRVFEPRLRALGIDASEAECRRLAACETNPDIEYLAAFVGRRANKIVDLSAGPAAPLIMRMRDRLEVLCALGKFASASQKRASAEEQFPQQCPPGDDRLGRPGKTRRRSRPAGSAQRPMSIISRSISMESTTGIVRSFDGRFEPLGLLAVQLEVNFIGSGATDEHTFHNTDRFMRRQGFDLFRLDVRTTFDAHSRRAMSGLFGETLSGRPFQERGPITPADILGPKGAEWAKSSSSAEKLAKLAAVFSAWDNPMRRRTAAWSAQRTPRRCSISTPASTLVAQTRSVSSDRSAIVITWPSSEADSASFYRRGDIPMRERWERLARILEASPTALGFLLQPPPSACCQYAVVWPAAL